MTRKVIVHNYWPPRFLTRGLDSAAIKAKRKKTKDNEAVKSWAKNAKVRSRPAGYTIESGSYNAENAPSPLPSKSYLGDPVTGRPFQNRSDAVAYLQKLRSGTIDEDKRWRVSVQMIDPAQLTHHKYAQKFFQTNASSASEAEAKAAEFYRKRGYRNIKPVAESIKTSDAERPSAEHGLLSPSGSISKRVRSAALERERVKLFGLSGLQKEPVRQPGKKESLLRQAKELRGLAARGMKPIAYLKRAEALEKEAEELV